jgi:hypothetical protein
VRLIDGTARYVDWGMPSQELHSMFTPRATGWYRFALQYANTNGPINTGITAAVKSVTARCGSEADQIGSVAMPQQDDAAAWRFSTGFLFKANANGACELRVADGFNMSYLAHFERYTAGNGGRSGALNRADIAAARIELIRSAGPSP